MKKVTYDVKITVVFEMPDNYDPRDAFIDSEYEFITSWPVHVGDTDIYDYEITDVEIIEEIL